VLLITFPQVNSSDWDSIIADCDVLVAVYIISLVTSELWLA
jgi:hypothetical protein